MSVGAGRKVEMKVEEETEVKKEEVKEEKKESIEIVPESENHEVSSEDLIAEYSYKSDLTISDNHDGEGEIFKDDHLRITLMMKKYVLVISFNLD